MLLAKAAKDKYANTFYLDVRSLATFRIYFGLLICWYTLWMWLQASAFFLDSGVLPNALAASLTNYTWPFLILFPLDQPWILHLVFFILFTSTVLFTLGYRSSIFALLVWFIWNCLSARNEYVWHTGDCLIRIAFFWAAFLNLDSHFAIKRKTSEQALTGVAATALITQVFIEYFFAGLAKLNSAWADGIGLYYSLSQEQFTSPIIKSFFNLDFEILHTLNYSILILEIVMAFLLFIPSRSGWNRNLFIILFSGLHLGIAVFMKLHIFPYVSIAFLIALVPSSFWNKKENSAPSIEVVRYPQVLGFFLKLVLLATILSNILWFGAKYTSDPDRSEQIARKTQKIFGLFQNWQLFSISRQPKTLDITAAGTTERGRKIDLLNQVELPSDDYNQVQIFPNALWRQYSFGLAGTFLPDLHEAYGKSLCHTWNRSNSLDPIREFRIIYLKKNLTLTRDSIETPTLVSESKSFSCY